MPDDHTPPQQNAPAAANRGVPAHAVGTPIYDETVTALVPTDDPGHDQGHDHGDLAAVAQHSYTPPRDPEAVSERDSPVDAAIHRLVRRLRDIPRRGIRWETGEVIHELGVWLAEEAGLHPSPPSSNVIFMARIATGHPDPAPIIRSDFTGLARGLGPRTTIDLISGTGEIARIEQYPFPANDADPRG